jgi:Spy/CpxP family protein refolding chaperone
VKRLTQIVMAAGIFALAAAGPAMAHGHCGGGHGFHGGPMPPPFMMTLRAANLTSAQKDQVHKILDASHAQAKPLFKKLHALREQIADKLLSTGKLSMNDLAPLQKEQSQIREQLDQQMMETALKVRAVLTPEQLKKVADVNAKLKGIHKQIEALMGPPPSDPPLPPPADQMP